MVSLTAERLRELLDYDPETGQFTWIKRRAGKSKVGKIAGCVKASGYVKIGIDNNVYNAHRLAWLWMTGDWPITELDHINCVSADNRFSNLREVSRGQNMQNSRLRKDNAVGYKGVHQHGTKYQARISYAGKSLHLGTFNTPEEASVARNAAAAQLHGEYGRA